MTKVWVMITYEGVFGVYEDCDFAKYVAGKNGLVSHFSHLNKYSLYAKGSGVQVGEIVCKQIIKEAQNETT